MTTPKQVVQRNGGSARARLIATRYATICEKSREASISWSSQSPSIRLPKWVNRLPKTLRDGQTIAKWTRSRGFEIGWEIKEITAAVELRDRAYRSLRGPQFWLQELSYRDKQVYLINQRVISDPLRSCLVEEWIRGEINRPNVFDGLPRGHCWEVVV